MATTPIPQEVDLFIKTTGAREAKSSIDGLSKSLTNLAGKALKGGIEKVLEFHKALSQSSALVSRYGVSLGALEKSIKGVSRATSLTTMETSKMFKEYRQSSAMPTLEGYRNMMVRIHDAVGTNVEAMREMKGILTSFSSKDVEWARQLETIQKGQEKFFIRDLEYKAKMGELSREEYDNAMAYVRGNQQITEGDKKRLDIIKSSIEAEGKLKKAREDLMISMGEQMVPALVKIADHMEKASIFAQNFAKWITIAAVAAVGFKMGGGILTGMGVGAAAGGGVGAAGAAGAVATPAAIAAAVLLAAESAFILLSDKHAERVAKGATKSSWMMGLLGVEPGGDFTELERRMKELQAMRAASGAGATEGAAEGAGAGAAGGDAIFGGKAYSQALEALEKLKSTHTDATNTMIQNIAIFGDLSSNIAEKRIQEERELIDFQIKTNEDNLRYLRETQTISVDKVINSELFTKSEKEAAIAAKETGANTVKLANHLEIQERLERNIAKLKNEQAKKSLQILEKRKVAINLADQEANLASKMVSLYDNYAIGVGASAAMRVRQFQAEEKAIGQLQAQLEDLRSQGINNREVQAQALEIENKILDRKMKQAQAVKSMRDGWISAISAMNTGAGIFTEIIMTADKNTAQVMRLGGAVRSSKGGAFGKKGENIGFRSYERFNTSGQIAGMGRGRYDLSYPTWMEQMMGVSGIRNIEMSQREMMSGMHRAGAYATGGGLESLSIGANPMRTGYATGEMTFNQALDKASTRIVISLTDMIEQKASEIAYRR